MEVDLPAELIEELAMMEAGHPTMRRLLQEANATNSSNTTNATFFLENVGTTYSCVAKSEYKAIATDFSLTGKSRQYTDGSFFCEDYVDYAAACDLNDLRHSCNNREAKRLYDNFERALSVYSCKSYSRIWTCTNCKKAYKRWLCGQIYRKYVIPDTAVVEEGTVPKNSYVCSCPWPEPTLDAVDKDTKAGAQPYCVRICNGLPKNCETVDGQSTPTCPRAACGSSGGPADPGRCSFSIYLDPAVSSGEDDFYKGATIELIENENLKGWYATIQEYDGYTKLAMFSAWNRPFGQETDPFKAPTQGTKYRIFLTDEQRGRCRRAADPAVRLGPPCEQQEQFAIGLPDPVGFAPPPTATNAAGSPVCVDGTDPYDPAKCATGGGFADPAGADPLVPNVKYRYPAPSMTLGGARCADTEMCIRVPQKNATSPNGTETGFACCPKSRYQIKTVSTAEEWKVYTLQETGTDLAADPPFVNYTCAVQNGETYDEAKAPTNPMELTLPAKLAESGVRASGCSVNFTAFPDRTVDDCLLKTCRPVCLDVNRRCPRELGFECPPLDDWREYDDNTCNMLVPHGCMLQVRAGESTKRCGLINPKGYGSQDDTDRFPVATWLTGSEIFGLPEVTSCEKAPGVDINAGDGTINPPAVGPPFKANSTHPYDVWCVTVTAAERKDGLELPAEFGPGCREIRYRGVYDKACAYPASGEAQVATEE